MIKQDHRPLDETRQLIIDCLTEYDTPLTRTQIARHLKRRKTPHLITIIDDLVADGYLMRDVITFNNGVQGYVYALNH